MSLRKSSIVFLIAGSFLGGAIAGGGFNELRHRSAQATDRALFSAKLRCQKIGQKYSTDNSIGTATTAVLKVDYSPTSHSCIAEIEERTTALTSVRCQIQDIVTNELCGGEICADSNDCDKRSGEIDDKLNALFARAVSAKLSRWAGKPSAMSRRSSRIDPRSFDLTTLCPVCGYKIPAAELLRVGWSTIRCPACKQEFDEMAGKKPVSTSLANEKRPL